MRKLFAILIIVAFGMCMPASAFAADDGNSGSDSSQSDNSQSDNKDKKDDNGNDKKDADDQNSDDQGDDNQGDDQNTGDDNQGDDNQGGQDQGPAVDPNASLKSAAVAPAAESKSAKKDKEDITICHRTNSESNPYRVESPDKDGLVFGTSHHVSHTGPVFSLGLKAQHIKWGDIIPEFDFKGEHFGGLNFNAAGQEIYNNGCKLGGDNPGNPGDPGDDDDDDHHGHHDGHHKHHKHHASGLPDTGAPSMWNLYIGSLLVLTGLALVAKPEAIAGIVGAGSAPASFEWADVRRFDWADYRGVNTHAHRRVSAPQLALGLALASMVMVLSRRWMQ